MVSESITPRFSTMTNDMDPTSGGADEAATAAATPADPAAVSAETPDAAPAAPAEPPPPSFDDMGLHPDVKLALDDMGYFSPTPVQTAVFKPVSEGKDLLV